MTQSDAAYWDDQAGTFDDEPDHGLRDPDTRAAWRDVLLPHLPAAPADVIDLGCGTGTLSTLLATAGYDVRGLDFSSAMVERAGAKAASSGVAVDFRRGDAANPPYEEGSCDVVLSRHVLWAMPDPLAALQRWCALLRPDGTLILIEGRWSSGAGLTSTQCAELVLQCRQSVVVQRLPDPVLWGRPIDDERYLLVSTA